MCYVLPFPEDEDMARRSDTFKRVALAGVESGISVQEVADNLGLARSALYAWVAKERVASARPAEELYECALAGIANDVTALVEATDQLDMRVNHVGQLVALMAQWSVAPAVSEDGAQS